MPVKPQVKTLTNNSVDVLNAIRSSATQNYKDYVPVATANGENLKEIGAVIMDSPSLQNEFLNALVNRIGRVIVTSKMYDNPLAILKQGVLEYGEVIEEIFVALAKPYQFDPEFSETNVFKREIPDVKAAFHVMNYQKYYKATVSNDQLRQAFLSLEGITDLISRIVEQMYAGANYDEFVVTKYMLAKYILNGMMYVEEIPQTTKDNATDIVTAVKSMSNDLRFMSDKYNLAKVRNYTDWSDQYILIDTKFDAMMDVNVLAAAFNMDKAEFIGRRILVDGFGNLDIERLSEIFASDPTYTEIASDDLTKLNAIPIMIVDKNFFMIFDNFYNFTELYNGEGLYWNYWYHVWKTFSISPFANAVVFNSVTPEVTAVEISPEAVSIKVGQKAILTASVTTAGFAPESVDWTITAGSEYGTIDNKGNVTGTAAGTITIKATSTFDSTKSDTATVTVTA